MALVLLLVLFALTGCALALATRTPSSAPGRDNERSATVPVPLIRLWWPDVESPVPRAALTPRPFAEPLPD